MSEHLPPIGLHDVPELAEVIVAEDIKLRPMVDTDAEQILAVIAKDESIRQRVSVAAKMRTPEDVAEQVAAFSEDPHLIRYVVESDDKVVGLISFWRDVDNPFDAPDNPDDYGFGYFLDPDCRGRGIITRSVSELMSVSQRELEVNRFVAFCEDENDDSVAILNKLGFIASDETFVEENHGWTERKYVRQHD